MGRTVTLVFVWQVGGFVKFAVESGASNRLGSSWKNSLLIAAVFAHRSPIRIALTASVGQ